MGSTPRDQEEMPGYDFDKALKDERARLAAMSGPTPSSPNTAVAWPTDQQILDCIRLTFPEKVAGQLSFKRWKDGIDIDIPTHETVLFAKQIFAMGLAAAPSSAVTVWQPIATAPKNGEPIILYVPINTPDRRILSGYWTDAGWWICSGSVILGKPTHWQKLDPPSSGRVGQSS